MKLHIPLKQKILFIIYLIIGNANLSAMIPAKKYISRTSAQACVMQIMQRSCSTIESQTLLTNDPQNHDKIVEFLDKQFTGAFDRHATIAKIAWPLRGFSYPEINKIMHRAQVLSDTKKISMESFYRTIAHTINGPPKAPELLALPHNQGVLIQGHLKKVAYHEAGHIVAELYNPTGYIIPMATAEKYTYVDGFTTRIYGYHDYKNPTQKHMINTMSVRLAGIVSEQVFGATAHPTDILTNLNEIVDLLYSESAGNDMSSFMESMHTIAQQKKLSDVEVKNLIMALYKKTYTCIDLHKPHITQLAESMIKKGSIYEDEIYNLPGAYKPLYACEPGPLIASHADQYIYRGQPDPYGYDEQGHYIGPDGCRDKDGNLKSIDTM